MTPRGRPPVGPDIHVRLPPDLLERVDNYADRAGVKRAEAVRVLLEAGLVVAGSAGGRPHPTTGDESRAGDA